MALVLPAGAGAHAVSAPAAATALGPTSCPGAAIEPTQVITGEFGTELQGSFVLLPFHGPGRHDRRAGQVLLGPADRRPSTATRSTSASTRRAPSRGRSTDRREFRGWGGSSHPDVIVSPEGFKSEAEYVASPRTNAARQDHARLHARTDPAR